MGLFADLLAQNVASGDIVIEKPEEKKTIPSEYPKGIKISLDYYNRIGGDSLGFTPICDVHDVYSDAEVSSLKQKFFPNCNRLEWRDYELVPVYKYAILPGVKVLDSAISGIPFPTQYAEVDKISWTYIPYSEDNVQRVMEVQYEATKILKQIRYTVAQMNSDNAVYKEHLIRKEFVINVFDYIKIDGFNIANISLPKWLEVRELVLSKHPELRY